MSDWASVYPSGYRIGVYAASRLSAQLRVGDGAAPGLIFREQRGGDTGLNAHLELVEEYPRMGKVVGLQIRSDPTSWESGEDTVERTARGYICRGEMAHVAYWFQHSLPVLVMVYEREQDRIVWEAVSPDTVEISDRHWELLVPYDQVYGQEAVGHIADLPCYSPYLARLALDQPWMQLIDSGQDILLEMDEWLNRPSERGSLRLSVLDAGGGRESVYEWPFQTDPDMPHVFRLASLFPWANIEVDQAFYREKLGGPDEGLGFELEEPSPEGLSPWIVEAGEIARFRLRLSLNELGRAFLTAEKFLRRGEFPRAEAPTGFGSEYERGLKFRLYNRRG